MLDFSPFLLQYCETKGSSWESQGACGSFDTSYRCHGALVVLLYFMIGSEVKRFLQPEFTDLQVITANGTPLNKALYNKKKNEAD